MENLLDAKIWIHFLTYKEMTMESIKDILMRRDGMTANEAEDLIAEAKEELYERLANDEDAYDICQEFFGLEPEFLMELLD